MNDVIASDHKPISFDIAGIDINHKEISVTVDSDVCSVPMWNNCDDKTLAYYTSYVDHLLQYVTIPYDALFDTTRDKVHLTDIDKFYTDICACLSKAIKDVIPCRNRPVSDFNVPGWNTYVALKHEAAREAYMVWMDMGKPRSGYYADTMRKTRATFKLALRFCRNHIEELKADACAENVFKKDSGKFWNSVYKVSNKATCHAISVGVVTGP